ncbi:MAG: acyl-[Lachnospiraceae bacterium]|nr:acyl-[acyl-carrier-protein] thioesterase [Lachnospiraceae bacterium]
MYKFDSRIRYSECDSEGKLAVTSLLNYFQDCSTLQSEDLGIGVKALHKRGTMWVVNSWQIDIIRLPELSERVETGTLPYEVRGFFGKRNFYMKDARGEYLAKADSLWTYISMKTASPERIPQDIIDGYGEDHRLDMDYQGRKISYPKDENAGVVSQDIQVTEYLLDANHHVNNGKYVELAAGLVRESSKAKRIRVEYRKQAFLGEIIRPVIYRSDEKTVVNLTDTEGSPYSVVELKTASQIAEGAGK